MISVNANTEKKTTVSVIRVGSPTPSMGSSGDSSDKEDVDDEENSDNSMSEDEEKPKSKKRKDAVPRIALTVENFYNPVEANKFAEEIMSKPTHFSNLTINILYLIHLICFQILRVSQIHVN